MTLRMSWESEEQHDARERRIGALTERERIRKAQAGALREQKKLIEFVAANGDYCDERCDFVAGKHADGCIPADMFAWLRQLRAATREPK